MKKILFFISIAFFPLIGHSQVVGHQRTIPDILPNSTVHHPHRSDNRHHMRNRTFGKRADFNKDKRRHRHNTRGRAHISRMG